MTRDIVSMLIPVFAMVILMAVVTGVMRKTGLRNIKGDEYDERQEFLRGKIYRRAFLVTLVLLALYALVVSLGGKPIMEDGVAGLLIAFIGIGFFAVTCVLNGAFFGLRQKPGLYLVICGLCVFSCATGGIANLLSGECVRDGLLTFACLPLVVGALFLAVFLTIIYQLYIRKEAEEE